MHSKLITSRHLRIIERNSANFKNPIFCISYFVIVHTRYIPVYENKIKYTNTYTRLQNCQIYIGKLAIVHF